MTEYRWVTLYDLIAKSENCNNGHVAVAQPVPKTPALCKQVRITLVDNVPVLAELVDTLRKPSFTERHA